MSCTRKKKKICRNNPTVVKVSGLILENAGGLCSLGVLGGLFVYLLKCTFWNHLLQERAIGKNREVI